MSAAQSPAPFANFAPPLGVPSALRQAITNAYRMPEAAAVPPLLKAARLPDSSRASIATMTCDLVTRLREKGQSGGVDGLVSEYSLSSQEGVALMCLAEALLRVPDNATRDALIRDKIASGNWSAHLGEDRSIFVNAATWGLVVSGKLVAPVQEDSLTSSLTGLIRRAGEPVIRSGVNMAMEMMGEQFVTGETIAEALDRAREQEKRSFTYSYDMLGEAAMTMADAKHYYEDYERAIHAIGKAAAGRDVYQGPGISIKLSALHPRYERSQLSRVTAELLPKVRQLAMMAKQYDIGLNIDAEEADRLEVSLDVLEVLALDADLAGWDGLGFVVQAYGKRCPMVIDWLVDLAQRSGHRIMVRLVKGAYWDSEIKQAQVDGQADFPVFTRKVHTDLSYIACARKLLDARASVFPQFATHNAQTLATIHHLAGAAFALGDYEFQCLHGMGEALYDEVVGSQHLGRPCRIYAPVGTHETLLAYLVRRLLENGANSSFVNRIWDETIAVRHLAADPVDEATIVQPIGAPHPLINLPEQLYPARKNSRGIDLSDESALADLSSRLVGSAKVDWRAAATFDQGGVPDWEPVLNPADHRDTVGHVSWASEQQALSAVERAQDAQASWASISVETRADCLDRAANALEAETEQLLGLIMREAGKSAANAIAEVREAVDFLRYYATEARGGLIDAQSLGPVVCISPWNFPLAIFAGQVSAALVAGNTVLAKPAEETPLIAAHMVGLLYDAGVPREALQFLPGAGEVGAALVGAAGTCGVMFTGSTEVAKLIQHQLAKRTLKDGSPIPLIAETGGQNAMVVDSSALPEQVVRDVIASAFDSAGQRCSALRILCVQEDIADDLLDMLQGALAELQVGPTDQLAMDIGPVISAEAQGTINAHIDRLKVAGHRVDQLPLDDTATQHGTFVAPTIIEISEIAELGREVFGPVLHVVRYRRRDIGRLVRHINETGYGLTFGIHSRIDETIAQVCGNVKAGNIYVNRNVIGAIVGVQPFGGRGLSGTGPKAGGPLYLGRLVCAGKDVLGQMSPIADLPGPVGERNLYALHPRGRVLLLAQTAQGLQTQLEAVMASGNIPAVPDSALTLAETLLPEVFARLEWVGEWTNQPPFDHILIESDGQDICPILRMIAAKDGPIPIVQMGGAEGGYRLDWMVEEVSTSINTTAAGGNASLMAVV